MSIVYCTRALQLPYPDPFRGSPCSASIKWTSPPSLPHPSRVLVLLSLFRNHCTMAAFNDIEFVGIGADRTISLPSRLDEMQQRSSVISLASVASDVQR